MCRAKCEKQPMLKMPTNFLSVEVFFVIVTIVRREEERELSFEMFNMHGHGRAHLNAVLEMVKNVECKIGCMNKVGCCFESFVSGSGYKQPNTRELRESSCWSIEAENLRNVLYCRRDVVNSNSIYALLYLVHVVV